MVSIDTAVPSITVTVVGETAPAGTPAGAGDQRTLPVGGGAVAGA